MRRHITLALAICSLCGVLACDDRDAREYAQKLTVVLDSYKEQTNQKIKAEKDSYAELAEIYERAARINVNDTLETERLERADRLADELIESDKLPSGSNIRDRLRDYAGYDFELSRKGLQQEADAKSLFLADIEGLEFDAQNIDALSATLKELTKPKSQFKRLKDYADFARATNDKLDELFCNDLASELKNLQDQVDSMKASIEKNKGELAWLNKQIAEIKARRLDKQCS